MMRLQAAWTLLLTCVWVGAQSPAQPERFAEIPIPNLELAATWLDAHRLLARIEDTDGSASFEITDARTGEQSPAFDHDALAATLSTQLSRHIDGKHLPIVRLGTKGDALLALIEPEAAVFAISNNGTTAKPFALSEATPFLLPPGDRRVRGSGRTTVQFVNALQQPVEVFWREGSGRRSYGNIRPGASKRQGTFVGHTWIVVAEDGTEYGPFVAREDPAIALVHAAARRDTRASRRDNSTEQQPTRPWTASIHDFNIVLTGRDGRTRRKITTDGTAQDRYAQPLRWSPDGTHLFAVRTKPTKPRTVHIVESSPSDQRQPKLKSFDYRKPGDPIDHHRPALFTIDVETGAARPIAVDNALCPTPWSKFRHVTWRDDSSAVVFTYIERGHRVTRVIGIDAETGDAEVLIDESPETFFDYANKMFFQPIRDSREAIWMSERTGWNHLHRFDLATGEHLGPITAGDWVVRSVERVDHQLEQIWFRAMGVHADQDPYHVHFGRVNFDGSGLTWLTQSNGTHTVRYSPGGDFLIATHSRADLAPVHELRRTSDGQLIAEIARADTWAIAEAGWRPPEVFHAPGRDGMTDIWGMIYTPADFSPDRTYPVVEQIYAGPHGHHVPKSFSRRRGGPQSIADLGFVVVQIDGMGTNWRSKAFHDVAWKNLADAGFPDRKLWMRAAAATRPWMDLSRVGIIGGSAGGQNAMAALLHHNDFYDVAVADCGCHDNRMDKIWWNELWMSWPIDDAAYDASSNVTQAHKLQGDLLLIVGELDTNVDPASTMQVVDALIKGDKDFDMLVIPGAGHGAAGTPYGRRRTLDFLVEHLIEHPDDEG